MPLHPFIVGMLKKFEEIGRPGLSDGTPADARALVAQGRDALGKGPDIELVEDVVIATRSGSIGGRFYKPAADIEGLLIYVHGGGWVIGTLDDYDTLARELASLSGCAVLVPDYRLAPEYPFPAGLHDVEDTLRWAKLSLPTLAGRVVPLVVSGDSAGANLATVAARSLRGVVDIALQVLIYPVADCDFDTPSYLDHGAGLPLTRKDMMWFFELYAAREQWSNPEISPLRASEHIGVPPALIMVAEYDVLCKEGEAYAEALRQAGVKAVLKQYSGLPHGFIRMHNLLDDARRAVVDVAEAARLACRQF